MPYPDLHQIIEELGRLDKSLLKHQAQLERILLELTKNQPEVLVSPEFKDRLLKQLMIKARELQREHLLEKSARSPFWGGSWGWALRGGLTVSVLVLVVSVWAANSGYLVWPNEGVNQKIAFKESGKLSQADSLSERAFGPLTLSSAGSGGASVVLEAASPSQQMLGVTATPPNSTYLPQADSAVDPVPYYRYDGSDFSQPEVQVAVLKRKSFSTNEASVQQKKILVDPQGRQPLDLSTFKELKIETINLTEASQDGYNVYLDNNQGS